MKHVYSNTKNPILPVNIHIPDGEAHVMPDGNLYVYGSYDLPEYEYCSSVYKVVSTSDMKSWTLHEESFNGETIEWKEDIDISIYPDHTNEIETKMMKSISEKEKFQLSENNEKPMYITDKKLLYAPDVCYHDGKYMLYFCTNDSEEGVAFSDKPEGPFTNPIKLPCKGIDPAIFIDNDGKGYYYWGQFYSHAVALEDDMVSFKQENVQHHVITEDKHFFHEGFSMRRIGNTYYAVYADMERGKPTSLGYATSKSPLGPFTYQGIIIDNDGCDPCAWNNHGSIECFQGQWYVFYHRCSKNNKSCRRLCIEPITINEDGTIDEVIMTSQGPGLPYAPEESIMGYQACQLQGALYIDVHHKYGEAITNIHNDDKAYFRYVENQKAYTKVQFECEGDGSIEVYMNGELVNIYEIVDGLQSKEEFLVEAGNYEVMLVFKNVNQLNFLKCVMS